MKLRFLHLLFLFAALVSAVAMPAWSETVSFGSVAHGESKTLTVSFQFARATTLSGVAVLTSGAANLDFQEAAGGTCVTGRSYYAKGSCTVEVTFAPKSTGSRWGAVVLDEAGAPIATTYLNGAGLGAQIIFPWAHPAAVPIPAVLEGAPAAIAVDGSGNLYIGDDGPPGANNSRVLKETLSQGRYTQTTIASGLASAAYLAVDGAGNVFVDSGASLYKLTRSGSAYTRSAIYLGYKLASVAVDGAGNVYFLSEGSLYAALLQPGGSYAVSVPLPMPGLNSSDTLGELGQVAVDGHGNILFSANVTVQDIYNGEIPTTYSEVFEEVPSESTYTATQLGVKSVSVKDAANATVPNLSIATDLFGDLYTWGGPLFSTPSWNSLSEFALQTCGSETDMCYDGVSWGGNLGDIYTAGPGNTWKLSSISANDVTVDAQGNVYVASSRAITTTSGPQGAPINGIYKIDLASAPVETFSATVHGTANASPLAAIAANLGNASLKVSGVSFPEDFPSDSASYQFPGIGERCAAGVSVAPLGGCYVHFGFTPLAPLDGDASKTLAEEINLDADAWGAPAAIAVNGTEVEPTAATPTFSVAGGKYGEAQSVVLRDATAGAKVYYTTNGTAPTVASKVYSGAISVAATETIEAIAVADGYRSSAVAKSSYTIAP